MNKKQDISPILSGYKEFSKKPLTNNFKPPLKEDMSMCIDWFQFTILGQHPANIIHDLFEYDINQCTVTESGINGYNKTYTIGDKINIMENTIRSDMGVNVLMSGSACREFEEFGSWPILISRIKSYPDYKYTAENTETEEIYKEEKIKKSYNINRIDIAIDLFRDIFTIQKIQNKLDKKEVITSFKKYSVQFEENTATNERYSETVHLGSQTSKLYIVFYNKLLERQNAGYEFDKEIDFWLRTEIRFKSDMAEMLFDKLATDYQNHAVFIDQLLISYVTFKQRSQKDSNKSRWMTSPWWSQFLSHAQAIKIQKQAATSSIVKKRRYADMNLSKFITLLTVADPNFIYQVLEQGQDKVKQSDLLAINRYFLQHNMQVLNFETFNKRVEELKRFYDHKNI